jgi:enoyl-CoA hydratase
VTEEAELVAYRLEAATPQGDALAAYLTLDDPARRNALSDALLDQLGALLQRAAADPRVRVMIARPSSNTLASPDSPPSSARLLGSKSR